MLKTTQVPVILAAAQSLTKHGEPELATQLIDMVKQDATHKQAVAAAATRRSGAGNGGAPAKCYAIETEPGGIEFHRGAKAAHAALVATVAQLGGGRTTPTHTSLAVMLSRKGHWFTLVETDNGTVAVTVRHATDKEIEQLTKD